MDTDAELEKVLHMPVGEYITHYGEEAFRKEETALLRPLVERWCALFGGDAEALMDGPFTVVTPDSKNPYRQMYAAN